MLFAYCLLALLLVFNPFTANNLLSFYFTADNYWSAFLLLPVIAVCAYCGTKVLWMQERKRDKIAVFFALLLIAVMTGGVPRDDSNIIKNENRAYLPDEYVSMFEKMNISDEPVVLLANDDIMESARAYSANIGLPYEVTLIQQSADVVKQFYSDDLVLVHTQMQQPVNLLGNITSTARAYRCNYLILPLEADDRSAMEYGGYEALAETEHYVLYYDIGETNE